MERNNDLLKYIADEVTEIRKEIKGLVSEKDCDNCKTQWREALSMKVDKRYFLGWGAAFVFVVAIVGLASKV